LPASGRFKKIVPTAPLTSTSSSSSNAGVVFSGIGHLPSLALFLIRRQKSELHANRVLTFAAAEPVG
jgi:hypothetical protein